MRAQWLTEGSPSSSADSHQAGAAHATFAQCGYCGELVSMPALGIHLRDSCLAAPRRTTGTEPRLGARVDGDVPPRDDEANITPQAYRFRAATEVCDWLRDHDLTSLGALL
jgi:hypothetical protein